MFSEKKHPIVKNELCPLPAKGSKPLTEEELEDAPDFFKELLGDKDDRPRRGMTYDPRELAE